jgi:hypothetical protein
MCPTYLAKQNKFAAAKKPRDPSHASAYSTPSYPGTGTKTRTRTKILNTFGVPGVVPAAAAQDERTHTLL